MKKAVYFKKASIIVTIIGVMIGGGIAISVFLLGESDVLSIITKCYLFSIPLWIILIQGLKKKAEELNCEDSS